MSLSAQACAEIRDFISRVPGVLGFALVIEKDGSVFELVAANISLDTGAAVLGQMAAEARLAEDRPARIN